MTFIPGTGRDFSGRLGYSLGKHSRSFNKTEDMNCKKRGEQHIYTQHFNKYTSWNLILCQQNRTHQLIENATTIGSMGSPLLCDQPSSCCDPLFKPLKRDNGQSRLLICSSQFAQPKCLYLPTCFMVNVGQIYWFHDTSQVIYKSKFKV